MAGIIVLLFFILLIGLLVVLPIVNAVSRLSAMETLMTNNNGPVTISI